VSQPAQNVQISDLKVSQFAHNIGSVWLLGLIDGVVFELGSGHRIVDGTVVILATAQQITDGVVGS
jgi:hypothetical protein